MRLLLSGNHVQSTRYLNELKASGKDTTDIKIISDPYMIRGVERGTEIILQGTYNMRSDWDKFQDSISMRFLKVTYA